MVATFQYLNGGAHGNAVELGRARIFNGEVWTRTGFLALGPDEFENTSTLAGDYGTLSIDGFGNWSYALNAAAQALAQGETVVDRFHLRVTDQFGLSNSQPLDITVNGANDAPVAVADANSVIEDVLTTATGNVLDNDIDVDHGAVLSVLNFGTFNLAYGTLTLNSDGSYVYQLDHAKADFLAAGQVVHDVFNYVLTDGFASRSPWDRLHSTSPSPAPPTWPRRPTARCSRTARAATSGQLALEGSEQVDRSHRLGRGNATRRLPRRDRQPECPTRHPRRPDAHSHHRRLRQQQPVARTDTRQPSLATLRLVRGKPRSPGDGRLGGRAQPGGARVPGPCRDAQHRHQR